MHTIFGDLDYVQGYLRMGHLEMELNDEDFEKFKSLSLTKRMAVKDFRVEYCGSITEINY